MKVIKIVLWISVLFALALGIALAFFIPRTNAAASNISSVSPNYFAWNDVVGWIDFYVNGNGTLVGNTALQGYASSSLGTISLDCATTPNGNTCATVNYGVCNGLGAHQTDGTCTNTANPGILKGYAWNDTIGWISMSCDTTNDCSTSNYRVTINTSTGDFHGYAWNDVVGWISFNSELVSPSYKVNTLWRKIISNAFLESGIFDTKIQKGATLNSIIWHGDNPPSSEGGVDFQIAVSQSTSGPWIFKGLGGDTTSYYGQPCPAIGPSLGSGGAPPNTPICVDSSQVSNFRYLRYKVRLRPDPTGTYTPVVKKIILNWSP